MKQTLNFTNSLITRLMALVKNQPQIKRVLCRLFENKKMRQIFGANLMAFALLSGLVANPISAFTGNPETEMTAAVPEVVEVTTEDSIRQPLDSFKVTQGYHFFHRAVDLKEVVGAPIYPLKSGVVEEVSYGRFGYGQYVLIDHGDGFESLYAHLAKVVVAEGEAVDENTVLGTVGTTGWTTGSHLHLEVYDHGQPFNPLMILK